jgi:hypothetical protein
MTQIKIDKQIVYVTGLPRSGSTLLSVCGICVRFSVLASAQHRKTLLFKKKFDCFEKSGSFQSIRKGGVPDADA